MSYKNLKENKGAGFTIIEVLIVLAIAGLILLIVFLAVPALQRNSRNTAIKNDVQNVLGGVAEFQGANSGTMPTSISGTGKINYTGATNDTSINIQGSTVVTANNALTTVPTTLTLGTITVVVGKKCPTTAGGNLGVSARAVAAIYSIETASATVVQCQDS